MTDDCKEKRGGTPLRTAGRDAGRTAEPSGVRSVRATLDPAILAWDEDDVPRALSVDDRYYSADGGRAESEAVFLRQSLLPERWSEPAPGSERRAFVIGELGFGTGLNFFLTWQLWSRHHRPGGRLHYISCENAPIAPADRRRAFARWPDLLALAERFHALVPIPFSGIHRVRVDQNVWLTLLHGDARQLWKQCDAAVDAWFLDGFAPARCDDLWSDDVLSQVARLSAPDATVATYTVAGEVRRRLARYGFECEKQPGFGRKAEMLSGRYIGKASIPSREIPNVPDGVIVIGGGLAGTAVALSFACRGSRVDLFDRAEHLASGASGNSAGIVMPHLAFPHEVMSRWYRAGFSAALAQWHHFRELGVNIAGSQTGVVRLASSERLARLHQTLLECGGDPPFFETLDRDALSDRAGVPLSAGGFFVPSGGWVSPPDVAAGNLTAASHVSPTGGIHFHPLAELQMLVRRDDRWVILSREARELASSAVVVLALGPQVLDLEQTRYLPLESVRGQVIEFPSAQGAPLRTVVCYDGYVVPGAHGRDLLGATYDHHDPFEGARDEQSADLIARAREWIKAPMHYRIEDGTSRVSFRTMSRDRLPFVGAVPDLDQLRVWRPPFRSDAEIAGANHPGLFLSAGHGSRGLISAHLAAEILASSICGEPMPLERDLRAASEPSRFAVRLARRGSLINQETLGALQVKPPKRGA